MEHIVKSTRTKWSIVRLILLALCAIMFAVGFFAITHRQSAVMAMAVSAAVALITVFWTKLRALLTKIRIHRAGRVITNTIAACMLAGVLYAAVISALMLGALAGSHPGGATLVVLGCQVRGQEPSLMLYLRMNTALEFLRDNPDADAVLSGGQGSGEQIAEAEAMRRYLTANGVSGDRLFIEDESTSTYENILFSKAIIEERGLSQSIAIVTDGFHQFRAQSFAKGAGLTPAAVTSATPGYTLPYYWLREIAAITVQVVFGMNLLGSETAAA